MSKRDMPMANILYVYAIYAESPSRQRTTKPKIILKNDNIFIFYFHFDSFAFRILIPIESAWYIIFILYFFVVVSILAVYYRSAAMPIYLELQTGFVFEPDENESNEQKQRWRAAGRSDWSFLERKTESTGGGFLHRDAADAVAERSLVPRQSFAILIERQNLTSDGNVATAAARIDFINFSPTNAILINYI